MRWLGPITPWVVFLVFFLVTSGIVYYFDIDPLSKAERIIISDEGIFLQTAEGRTLGLGESIKTIYLSGFYSTLAGILAALVTEFLSRRRKKIGLPPPIRAAFFTSPILFQFLPKVFWLRKKLHAGVLSK